MKENIEIEYKIILTKAEFEALCSFYPQLDFKTQINTYYDTPSMQLKNKHCAMRIREKQDTFLFTLKSPSPTGLLEHELYLNENSEKALHIPEIQSLLNNLGITEEVHALASCQTDRAVLITPDAEICFDVNHYNGIIDYEIEYEYLNDHDGITVFNELLSKIGMNYKENGKSKIARTMESL